MEWLEAKVFTSPEGIEPVSAMLMSCGIQGILIQDEQEMRRFLTENPLQWDYIDEALFAKGQPEAYVQFYVPDDPNGLESLTAVKNSLDYLQGLDLGFPMGRLALVHEIVDDKDWLEHWKKYYKPFRIGRIVIRPSWEAYTGKDDEIVFTINPGHVFGTGLHQTTQLCIEELDKQGVEDKSILDLGCGSGILSIIALMLGASDALAIDLDPCAVDIAYENAMLNHVSRDAYSVLSGNVLRDQALRKSVSQREYDVAVANIVADVIIELAGFVKGCLRPGGVFISSGIIIERVAEVECALENSGFTVKEILNKDDWICIVSVHSEG